MPSSFSTPPSQGDYSGKLQFKMLQFPGSRAILTHTKVLEAWIDGKPISKPKWNLLLEYMLRLTKGSAGKFEQLRQLCPVNIIEGRKADEGYSYLSEINDSVQVQDSKGACRALVLAAQAVGVALDVGFMWRLKEAAAYLG